MCRLLLRRIKWSRTTKCPPKLLGPFGEEPLQSGEKKQMALAMTFFTHGQSRQAVNRRDFQMRARDAFAFSSSPFNHNAPPPAPADILLCAKVSTQCRLINKHPNKISHNFFKNCA